MITTLDLSADLIDVRDIIARVEELREEREAYIGVATWEKDNESDDEELTGLEAILEDLAGNGGDEKWKGVWYPVTLIADSYFETAMDELLEDIGELPKNIPSYLTITIDYDALQQDYTSTEIEGETYWYR